LKREINAAREIARQWVQRTNGGLKNTWANLGLIYKWRSIPVHCFSPDPYEILGIARVEIKEKRMILSV